MKWSPRELEMEVTKILVENFRESVHLYEKCILWAFGTSASSVLIVIQMRSLGDTAIQGAHVELLFSQIGLHTAWLLTLPIYFVLGLYAMFTVEKAHNIIELFDPDIRTAVKYYPSFATEKNKLFRLGAPILGVVLMLSSLISEFVREGLPKWRETFGWAGGFVVAFILFAPYSAIWWELRQPLGVRQQPATATLPTT